MFADSYQATFAKLGVQLRKKDSCSDREIENAEQRLGIKVPQSLREYFLVAGREPRINQFFNRILPPEKLFVDAGRLVFMEENQWVVFWGVPVSMKPCTDAPVFQGVNQRDEGLEWLAEHDSCFKFLNVMALWHASFGGAATHTAAAYLDEAKARKTLESGWEFLGEVNEMRAYQQPGKAVCLVKWEEPEFMRKKRNVPPWRVFAAAASSEEMERLKKALPAKWEQWGE